MIIKKSYQVIKQFFLDCEKNIEEVTFFFHPDNNDGEIDISYNENGDFDTDLYLPELANLMDKNNLGTYNKVKYEIFKNHIITTLRELKKEGIFKQQFLYVYSQHVDGVKEIALGIEPKKNKNLFPHPQNYSFNLSMVNQENGENKWWKVITPTWQKNRPFQNLELSPNTIDQVPFYSQSGTSLHHVGIKNLQLVSEHKIKKIWDYESSDLDEVFSERFCQLLNQIGVNNIEYYPMTVTCKATGESSNSYYKLANIVGLVEGIFFYDRSDFEKGTETMVKGKRVGAAMSVLKAKKEVLDGIEEKVIRCKDSPTIFIVDNDIKEACDINVITGIDFEEIGFVE